MVAAGLIALDGVGRMDAGVFACDPGCGGHSLDQELHHTLATVGFLSGALILLLLMTWPGNPVHAVGLFEHLATAVLSLWILVFAVHINGPTLNPETP